MDDSSRRDAEQAQESTRWLLLVLGTTAVLAAAVILVADIPDLIGNRWQQVGVVSAGTTIVALVLGLLAVLRALDPFSDALLVDGDEQPTPPVDDEPDLDDESGTEVAPLDALPADVSFAGDQAEVIEESAGVAPRRARRRAIHRYRTTRLVVAVAVVVALAGMAGMAIASVQDGNKVEFRARLAAAVEAELPQDAPIAEPQAVAVQLTTAGLAKIATAMRCTGADLGAAPLQGWAVSGDFQEPTVVIFTPSPACRNARVELAADDGFAYPTILAPLTTAAGATPSTTVPAGAAPAAPATTPPTTAAAPATP